MLFLTCLLNNILCAKNLERSGDILDMDAFVVCEDLLMEQNELR